jgi:hypothetical protein
MNRPGFGGGFSCGLGLSALKLVRYRAALTADRPPFSSLTSAMSARSDEGFARYRLHCAARRAGCRPSLSSVLQQHVGEIQQSARPHQRLPSARYRHPPANRERWRAPIANQALEAAGPLPDDFAPVIDSSKTCGDSDEKAGIKLRHRAQQIVEPRPIEHEGIQLGIGDDGR